MPRYRRFYLPNHPVFVTVVTHQRQPWLGDAENAQRLLAAMREVKQLHPYRHLAHAILPDHFHWLFEPDNTDFSKVVQAVKLNMTWGLKRGGAQGPFWQNRFLDHLIRDEQDLHNHLDYIHYNPVKHFLSENPESYPHTSFAEWRKRGHYEPGWGHTEPPAIQSMNPE